MDLAKVPYPFSKADKIPDHAQGKQECDQHDAVEHRIRRFPGKKTDEREKYDDTKIKGKKISKKADRKEISAFIINFD